MSPKKTQGALAALEKLGRGARNRRITGFLARYRKSESRARTRFVPLAVGFLKLEYDARELELASFVLEDHEDSPPIGPRLEIHGEEFTFIEMNAVSGVQWEGGAVHWGATYDDIEPVKLASVARDEWVDARIAEMVNPGPSLVKPLLADARRRR